MLACGSRRGKSLEERDGELVTGIAIGSRNELRGNKTMLMTRAVLGWREVECDLQNEGGVRRDQTGETAVGRDAVWSVKQYPLMCTVCGV